MATPDGRKAHTPLAEGASPASGTDHLGPTAVIGSVGKLPTAAILGGVLLNQKLNPATLENESDKQKLMILLRTFFEVHKGWHISTTSFPAKRCWMRKNIPISIAIW